MDAGSDDAESIAFRALSPCASPRRCSGGSRASAVTALAGEIGAEQRGLYRHCRQFAAAGPSVVRQGRARISRIIITPCSAPSAAPGSERPAGRRAAPGNSARHLCTCACALFRARVREQGPGPRRRLLGIGADRPSHDRLPCIISRRPASRSAARTARAVSSLQNPPRRQ